MGLTDYIARAPKAELHLHLEGSARGVALNALAQKYETELKDLSPAAIEERLFAFEDFPSFLRVFTVICAHLREAEDYCLLLDHLAEYCQTQNTRYAEVITSPSIAWRVGLDGEKILAALLERSREIEAHGGVRIRWILDCVRQFGDELARRTAELGVKYRDAGVVALGLGGDENSLPMREFEGTFLWAKANGLYIHAHAGEVGGVEQVWDAVRLLGANRIGHGIQAARDPRLMELLRERAITLDVCLTSNLKTRAWAPISSHPFALLYKRGVPVTLSTDDPGVFRTSLLAEYEKATKHFSLRREDIARLILQSVSSAFLPSREKSALMQEFQDAIHELAG
jgi:aminodeoxyfutalosine deaminase